MTQQNSDAEFITGIGVYKKFGLDSAKFDIVKISGDGDEELIMPDHRLYLLKDVHNFLVCPKELD